MLLGMIRNCQMFVHGHGLFLENLIFFLEMSSRCGPMFEAVWASTNSTSLDSGHRSSWCYVVHQASLCQ